MTVSACSRSRYAPPWPLRTRPLGRPDNIRQRGFTLLEVLVAVAVFAIAAALAYGGLRSIVSASAQSSDIKAQLGRLQFAVSLIERDITSVAQRSVRDAYGSQRPVLEGQSQRLELTRHGHANVLALPRAEMERVAYLRREERLIRQRWPVLDRAPGTQPIDDELLDGLERLDIDYIDSQGREHPQWPPPRDTGQTLPRAIRITLVVQHIGEIRRILELPQQAQP